MTIHHRMRLQQEAMIAAAGALAAEFAADSGTVETAIRAEVGELPHAPAENFPAALLVAVATVRATLEG